MGPRSRKRGENQLPPILPPLTSFNGAALAGARRDTSVSATIRFITPCFNGAALAGARRDEMSFDPKRLHFGFNGAALAGARRAN